MDFIKYIDIVLNNCAQFKHLDSKLFSASEHLMVRGCSIDEPFDISHLIKKSFKLKSLNLGSGIGVGLEVLKRLEIESLMLMLSSNHRNISSVLDIESLRFLGVEVKENLFEVLDGENLNVQEVKIMCEGGIKDRWDLIQCFSNVRSLSISGFKSKFNLMWRSH